jgi:hypothetical protein
MAYAGLPGGKTKAPAGTSVSFVFLRKAAVERTSLARMK